MPLGDSITFGTASSDGGGYRVGLFRSARSHGKSLTFVGSILSGPATVDGVAFPRNNEGHYGFITSGIPFISLEPLVVPAMTQSRPDIVTLMIGTNDMNNGFDVENAPTRLAGILDDITSTSPHVLLLVAQLTPSNSDVVNASIVAYNAAMPALVQERARAGKHIALVDMYEAFVADPGYRSELLADDVHPNAAGYARMAEVWYAKLGPALR